MNPATRLDNASGDKRVPSQAGHGTVVVYSATSRRVRAPRLSGSWSR